MLLVAGALAGARSLNEAAVEAFGESGPAVLHLTGERDFELVRARVSRDDYVVLPSTERFGAALGAADLALARAGGSVWELAAAGLPAVLVPYPHATADHQTRNAEHFERAGGAVVVPDSELARARRRRALAARGRREARRDARGDARRRAPGRRRGDRGGAGAACNGRSPVGASGSSGSAVRGCRATRSSRTRGGPTSAAGTARRRRTSRTSGLRASRCRSRPSPVVPDGWEAVVSSAFDVPGTSRAELLAELVSLQRSIVVAGAHGKTTTTAMIAFVLDRLGLDPSFLIGGEIPQLGGNARAGEGWLVVEGDESDRTISSLRPEIAVVLNVDLDHHATFGSLAEVQALFDAWLPHVPNVVRGEELEPVAFELQLPGEHNRRNAAAALAALELAGVDRARAEAGAAGVRRSRPPLRASRRRRRARLRRLRAQPGEGRRRARRGARARAAPRARPLPAASLLADAAPRARARASAQRSRRGRGHRRLRGARGTDWKA